MSALVSAIIPNYNDAATLGEAIEALLRQSYPHLEVIVVDDASTDNSVRVVSEWARRDPRVRLVRHEKNRGPIVAQLTGFAAATGKYVFCPSANDKVLPGFLEESMLAFRQHPEAGVAMCDLECIDDPDRDEVAGLGDRPIFLPPEELAAAFARRQFLLGGAGTIVRRAAWAEAGWMVPDLRWMADYFAMHVVAFRHGLCAIPGMLYAVRSPAYSQAGPRTPAHRRATLALLELLQSAAYLDVLPSFRSSGVLAAVPGFLRFVLPRPQYWFALSPLLVRRGTTNEVKDLLRPVIPAPMRNLYRRTRDRLRGRTHIAARASGVDMS